MLSDPGVRGENFPRPQDKVLITDFFGSVQGIELTSARYPLTPTVDAPPRQHDHREDPGHNNFSSGRRSTAQDGTSDHQAPKKAPLQAEVPAIPPFSPSSSLALSLAFLLAATISVISLL